MDIEQILEKVVSTILPFIEDIMSLVVIFIIYKMNGKIKNFTEVVQNMEFRTQNYKEVLNTSDEQLKGQSFSRYKKVYRLNEATNELEDTGDVIDVQELINSFADNCYDAILDRLLPTSETSDSDIVLEHSNMQSDLDELCVLSQRAEEYKDKFGLDKSLSISQVFDVVKSKAKELKTKIDISDKIISASSVKVDVKDNKVKVEEPSIGEKEIKNEKI